MLHITSHTMGKNGCFKIDVQIIFFPHLWMSSTPNQNLWSYRFPTTLGQNKLEYVGIVVPFFPFCDDCLAFLSKKRTWIVVHWSTPDPTLVDPYAILFEFDFFPWSFVIWMEFLCCQMLYGLRELDAMFAKWTSLDYMFVHTCFEKMMEALHTVKN
jgi:hypothetical protein